MERRPTDSDVMPAAVSDTPPKKARLPPEGRLAFVNAVKPEIARDFVLSCLSDDVGALIALVHASPAIRDLVAAQLTRLTCSGRVMCFVGANLLELDVSRRAGAERDGLADAGIRAIAERCPNLRSFSAANRGRVRDGATARTSAPSSNASTSTARAPARPASSPSRSAARTCALCTSAATRPACATRAWKPLARTASSWRRLPSARRRRMRASSPWRRGALRSRTSASTTART